jgi:ankyrin repeat protein
MDLPLPPPPKTTPFGLVSVCGLLTELEDVGRVVALAGYGHEARRLPFLCTSLARDDELLVATRTAVYGSQRRTRLMYAARSGDVRRVTALLRPRGAERGVDAVDAGGRTALHHASASGRVEVVRLLLDKGADKDKEDTYKGGKYTSRRWRPLHYASALGHAGVVRLLLQRGAATEVSDGRRNHREEPIHVACEHGHVDIVRLLLDAGTDMDVWDDELRTSYLLAIERGQEAVVLFLLDRGQDIDGFRAEGIMAGSPLSAAVRHEQVSMVWLLLDRGADMIEPDQHGSMVLYAAAWAPSVALTRLFLSLGADWETEDDDHRTPPDIAQDALRRAKKKVPVDPLEVQKLSEIVGIYEALLEQQQEEEEEEEEEGE